MLNWFLSTSILIAVILLLRHILRNKIDPRLTYALWLLVALRILIPGSFFSTPISVATFTEESGLSETVEQVRETVSPKSVLTTSVPADSELTMEDLEESWNSSLALHVYEVRPYTQEELAEIREENPHFYTDTDNIPIRMTAEKIVGNRPFWNWVYLAGCLVTLIVIGWSNRDFHKRVKKHRRPYEGELPIPCPVPVYVMPSLPSPCLYQMVRFAIYLNEAALKSDHLDHILTHEIVHYRHKDQWWAIVRILCLCVQWFNPLVWLAAYLSRQDCELACDASAIRILGEEQRLGYGRTLVDMIAAGRHPGVFLQSATTMTGGKKGIAQRITLIAKRPKMTAVTLVAVLLIAALTAACAFGGAEQKETSPALEDYFGSTYTMAGHSVVDFVRPISISYTPTAQSIGEITITENYFGCFEDTGLDWGENITNPVYREMDFDQTAYGLSDHFYPALDGFFGGYESITVYEIENAAKPTHLLLLDGELWLAINVGEANCYILRLEELSQAADSAVTAPQYLERHTEAELFDRFVVATYANREYATTAELTSDDLFRMAVLVSDEMKWYDEASALYVIPVSDLTEILDSYLASYQFDSAQVSYGKYDAAADTITAAALGFGTGMSDYSFKSASAVDAQTLRVCLSDAYSQDVVITAAVTESGVKFLSSVRAAATLPNITDPTEEISGLLWEFSPPSDNVTDTAFPVSFDFDYDHYNAHVDRGAGYIYSDEGTAFGLTLLEETGTLYWIPYRDRDTSNTDTPTLTVSVYDETDTTLFTATFTFRLVEKTDSGTTYSAEVTLHGNPSYICTRDPDTGGARFVETEPVPSNSILTEEYLTSLVISMEISMREPNSFTFSDPKELSATQLYTLFLLLTDYEILEQYYHAEEELFYFTSDFINAQLKKYFGDFHFDITQHERYDSGADAIVTPIASGFGGDRYTKLVTASWVNNTTVIFTLWFYNDYELSGDPYQAKTYTIEFYDGGYYFLSAVEASLPVTTPDPTDLAQSIYAAIVGDYDSRDCYMEIYDNRSGSGGTTTRIHLTEENSWNLPNTIGKYEFPNPNNASKYEWSYAEPCECATPLALTLISADGKTTLSCYEGCDAVNFNINGEYYLLTAKVPEGRSSSSALFPTLLRAAEDALIHEAYHIVIDGSISDYETVVEEYARQFAANLNALPDWAPSKPENVVYRASSVSQAYFGEGTENFCGAFGLYFSPEMGMSDWQAGSGMDQETEGEYADWWKWGIGADFARNEDGDWYCAGTYTGGVGLTYPTRLEEATLEQMVYYFYHTTPGHDHDYLIPYYICQQPVSSAEELNRLLGEYDDPAALCAALGAFLRDYGDYGDIQLTYDVLFSALSPEYRPHLETGYTKTPE